MALHHFEKTYDGYFTGGVWQLSLRRMGRIMDWEWPVSGKVISMRVSVRGGSFIGPWRMNTRNDGTFMFDAGSNFFIPGVAKYAEKTGLAIDVEKYKLGTLEWQSKGSGDPQAPCTIQFTIDDGLPPSVTDEYTLPSTDGTSGQVLQTDGDGVVTWETPTGGGGGSGDTIAPASNTDSFIPQWNGANSKTLKDGLQLDTDTALAANSDTRIASQKAIKAYADTKQASDSDLTAIAGLTPSNDDVIQRKAGAWTNRTMAQVKTDLALAKGDVGLGNVDNTSDSTKNAAAVTLTNKRIDPRVGTTTSSATPTPDADAHDEYNVTALAAGAVFAAPTGTPVNGQPLIIRIKDNGTARSLGFNAIYRAIGVTLPTTTVISKTMYLGMIYNGADSKWDVLAVNQES